MDDKPLFSKSLDELLPPESKKRGAARESAREGADEWEMKWWVSMLAGGFAVVFIMLVRSAIPFLMGDMEAIEPEEAAVLYGAGFAGGCVFGLLLWGFGQLKRRFARR